MAENILIKITAQSELAEANNELQNLADRERDIQMEMRKQQAEYGKQVANIQATVKGREAQIAALDKLRNAQTKQQAGLETELKKTKATLADFTEKMGAINDAVADGAVKTPRLKAQLAALKEELARLEIDGDNTSKTFINLSVKAGQLQDQIGDTRQTITILSSDTRRLDLAMGMGQGLGGAFNVATSAAALLGGESEQLTKAFMKVQAIQAILNGVNEVALMLNKNSVVMVNLQTFASESNTLAKVKNYTATTLQAIATKLQTGSESESVIVKGLSTAAQWALNAAVYAFPAVLILAAITAIAAGLYLYSSGAAAAAKEQEEFNKQVALFGENLDANKANQAAELELLKAQGAKKKTIREKELDDLQKNANDTDRVLALARERYLKQMQEGNSDEAKKTKEQLDTLLKLRDDAQKAKRDTENRYVIEDAAAQVAAINAAKVARIATMKDGRAKELAELQAGYAEKFKAITGNSEEEMALRTALIKQQIKEEGDINKRWRNKDIQDTVTQNAIKANILLEADKGNVALKESAARANAAVEIASVRASEDRASLKAAKIEQIETKLAADLKLLEYEKTNNLAALTALRDRNALQALTNAGEKESERRDELSAKILEDQAVIDIAAVKQSVASAESKAEQIRGIELKLAGDKKAIEDSALTRLMNATKDSNSRYLANERMTANMILANEGSTGQEKQAARQRLRLLETMGLNDAEDDIRQRYAEGLVDKQAFETAMFDIGQQRRQRELDDIKMKAEAEKAVREKLFEIGSTIVTSLFEAKRTSLDQEKSDLDKFYTTDANAAKENHNLKLISQKEMDKKQFDLKLRQAKLDKEQALFNIAISTAQAVMASLAAVPLPLGLPLMLANIALGAVQAGAVLAKPLPKYARGRKGGRGEWATVGEKGPETMWVPEGASIVPAHRKLDPATFAEFGIPNPYPHIDRWITDQATPGERIDYDRLGRSVAENIHIPEYKPSQVNLHVSDRGVRVQEGRTTTDILNKKYTGSWN